MNPTDDHFSKPLQLPLSAEILEKINTHLRELSPQQILQWALDRLPTLYQTTAFGLSGLVILDMLSKLTPSPPPLIFIDTLYHFPETLELVREVEYHYGYKVNVYKPDGCSSAAEFEAKYGQQLWQRDETKYDYLVKVEPARRAYAEHSVQSVITGRRASQGGERSSLQPLEVDSTGLLKLNPLFAWKFAEVEIYIKENDVPRNKLLSQGYKSVGDWHSTWTSGEGDAGERAGRWADRPGKTECGLHEDYFKIKLQTLKDVRDPKSKLLEVHTDVRIYE